MNSHGAHESQRPPITEGGAAEGLVGISITVNTVGALTSLPELQDALRRAITGVLGPIAAGSEVLIETSSEETIPPQFNKATERSLNDPLDEILEGCNWLQHGMGQRLYNCLTRDDILDLRTLIGCGKETVRDIRNLGDKGVGALTKVINSIDPTIVWKEKPPMADIVRLFTTLDAVPARIVSPEHITKRKTVMGILALSQEEIIEGLPNVDQTWDNPGTPDVSGAEDFVKKFRHFAEIYAEERSRIAEQLSKQK